MRTTWNSRPYRHIEVDNAMLRDFGHVFKGQLGAANSPWSVADGRVKTARVWWPPFLSVARFFLQKKFAAFGAKFFAPVEGCERVWCDDTPLRVTKITRAWQVVTRRICASLAQIWHPKACSEMLKDLHCKGTWQPSDLATIAKRGQKIWTKIWTWRPKFY